MCLLKLFRRKPKESADDKTKKKGTEKILEFNGDNSVMFTKSDYPIDPKDDSILAIIVPPTHSVFLIKDGVLSEELPQGKHRVEIVKKVSALKRELLITSLKIIYISKTVRLQTLWGTQPQQRVKYIDPKLGFQIDVGCFGKMEVRVCDAKKFYLEMVASFGENFLTSDLQDFVRTKIVSIICGSLRNVIDDNNLSYTDFDVNLLKLQNPLKDKLAASLYEDYGLEVCDFVIENVNISEENVIKINNYLKKQRARADEINDYRADRAFNEEKQADKENDERRRLKFRVETAADSQKVKALDREEEEYETAKRHEEEDRIWARQDQLLDREEKRDDKILDMTDKQQARDADVAAKAMYYDAVKQAGWANNADNKQPQQPQQPVSNYCSKCGNPYGKQDAYCPFCGNPTPTNTDTVNCPNCGKSVSVKNKFCPFCGTNVKNQR